VSGPFAGIKTNQKIRYALLAGTMLLPATLLPRASMAADSFVAQSSGRLIILAQAAPIDPATGKPVQKGAPPKGPPPKGATPPPGPPPGGGQPPAGAGAPPRGPAQGQGTPPQGVQPRQLAVPPKGNQPVQGQTGQPGGQPPAGGPQQGQGTPPQGVQPRQFGGPKGNQPVQGQTITPAGQPPAGQATSPATPGTPQGVQPRQFGGPKGVQPVPGQAVQPGGATPGVAPVPGQATPQQGVQPRQFGGPTTGPAAGQVYRPQPSVTNVTNVTVNVDQVRGQRQERREAGGRIVIQEPGNRFIVRENGRAFVRHDETERFRRWGGEPRLERRGTDQYAYISRPGGFQIVTVTDANGRLLRRMRRGPDGREVVLIENRLRPGIVVGVGAGLAAGIALGLAAPVITIPRERYIVDVSAAPAPLLYETLEAPPLVAIERPYSLDEIRYNVELRDRMRRIDIDSITFESGSWEVTPEQQPKLQGVAEAMLRVLQRNPDEVFMIEGHTDAVGNDVDNLSLSDRRAESVAVILTEVYQIPPENLVTQGYGEQHLKVPTDGPNRENRRVTGRRVTPLLNGGVASAQ
jgi:outer membrane protein OmpA-like peptidoglycan-associated protein